MEDIKLGKLRTPLTSPTLYSPDDARAADLGETSKLVP
jgi:hypothetical protein